MTTAGPLPSFAAIDPKDCPLLADDPAGAGELLGMANDCGRLLAELAAGPARAVLDQDAGRKLVVRYAKVRDLLTRATYRVGFLGTSQAGKSTIFNRVLKGSVAVSGGGKATTSLPSRLRKGPAERCDLFYMTLAQYKDRLRKLCLEVGISDSNVPEETLLEQVSQLKPTSAGAGDGQRRIRADDIEYL